MSETLETDLMKAVETFLSSLDDECFQPGERRDIARTNLVDQLNLERSKQSHNLNAHTYPQYNCLNCSNLLSRLKNMLDNLPGFKGLQTPEGHIGNKYVDYGYREAINRIILMITLPDYKGENTFELSGKSPYSERVQS